MGMLLSSRVSAAPAAPVAADKASSVPGESPARGAPRDALGNGLPGCFVHPCQPARSGDAPRCSRTDSLRFIIEAT